MGKQRRVEPQDTITIASNVLIAIAGHAATEVDGVSRTGTIPLNVMRLLKGNPMASGVILEINGQSVKIDIFLVVTAGVNIQDVSLEVQQSITRAVQELVGMDVVAVNVHVEDVDFPLSAQSRG